MTTVRLVILTVFCSHFTQAQFEESRCHCVCPSLKSNRTKDRVLYGGPFAHDECNCDVVVLPKIASAVTDERRLLSYCSHCECRYQSRNIRVIQVSVLSFILAFSALLLHLSYLSVTSRYGQTTLGGGKYRRQLLDEDENEQIYGSNGIFLRPTTEAFRHRGHSTDDKSDDSLPEQTVVS